MNKFTAFYEALMQDKNKKVQLERILCNKNIEEADMEELEQISKLALELGFDISAEEARDYLYVEERELDEEDLDAVAGGKTGEVRCNVIVCEIGGNANP